MNRISRRAFFHHQRGGVFFIDRARFIIHGSHVPLNACHVPKMRTDKAALLPVEVTVCLLTILMALLCRWSPESHICPPAGSLWTPMQWCLRAQPRCSMCSLHCSHIPRGSEDWISFLLSLLTCRHMLLQLEKNKKKRSQILCSFKTNSKLMILYYIVTSWKGRTGSHEPLRTYDTYGTHARTCTHTHEHTHIANVVEANPRP